MNEFCEACEKSLKSELHMFKGTIIAPIAIQCHMSEKSCLYDFICFLTKNYVPKDKE